MSFPDLANDRVRLRRVEARDFDAYLRAFVDDPDLANLLGLESDPTEEVLTARLDRPWLDPLELRGFEFAIADATSDYFLGSLFLHSCDWQNRRAETGFWVAPQARRTGVLGAALELILGWAFDTAGLERMELTALPENEIVPRIAERFGFTYEGTLRKRNFERGRRVDLLIWGLLSDERRESSLR